MSGPTARVLAFHTGTLAGAASTEGSAPLALGAPVVIPPQPHGRRPQHRHLLARGEQGQRRRMPRPRYQRRHGAPRSPPAAVASRNYLEQTRVIPSEARTPSAVAAKYATISNNHGVIPSEARDPLWLKPEGLRAEKAQLAGPMVDGRE